MKRDDLVRRLSALPSNVDVDVQIGEDHLNVVDLIRWGDSDNDFAALKCDSADFRDVLLAWYLPKSVRRRLIYGGGVEQPPNPAAEPRQEGEPRLD